MLFVKCVCDSLPKQTQHSDSAAFNEEHFCADNTKWILNGCILIKFINVHSLICIYNSQIGNMEFADFAQKIPTLMNAETST